MRVIKYPLDRINACPLKNAEMDRRDDNAAHSRESALMWREEFYRKGVQRRVISVRFIQHLVAFVGELFFLSFSVIRFPARLTNRLTARSKRFETLRDGRPLTSHAAQR